MKLICRNCRAEFDDEDGIYCPICGTKNGESEEENSTIESNQDDGNAMQQPSGSMKTNSSEEIEKILQDVRFYYQQSEEKKEGTKENPNVDYYERGVTLARRHLSDIEDYRIWWEAAKPIDFWNTEESDLSDKSDIQKAFFDKALELASLEEKKKLISEVDAYHQRKREKKQKEEERLLAEQQKQEEERLLAEQQQVEEERRKKEEEERRRAEEERRKEKERLEAERKAQAAKEEAERIAAMEEDRKRRTVAGIEYKTYEEADVARKSYQKLVEANRDATVSLVCGILSIVGCIIILPAIPLLIIGFIFSIKALKGETTNTRRAVAGMITSLVSLVIIIVCFSVAFSFASEVKSTISQNETAAVVTVETETEAETEKNTEEEPVEMEKSNENKTINENTTEVKEVVAGDEDVAESDMNEYLLPEADSRYYSREELEQLGFDSLRLARNEILARHGRIFESEDLYSYFSSKSWYHPQYTADEFDPQMDQILNAYEKANIEEIKKLENGEGTACLYQVTVNAPDGYVNLREGAGTNYKDIKKITNGVVLNVYTESADGKWLQTEYQGSSGWVAASQVEN